jgi:uncharacterized protein YkwD
MKRIFRRMTWLLMIAGMIVSLVVLAAPGPVQAATCTPKATLPADVSDPNAAFDTGAHVIASFNFARQQEGCNAPLSIDPATYDAASPQQQMLLLINAELQDRGLGALQLDATLLSQIQLNHGRELFQYNYFTTNPHSSPINQPNKNPWDRDLANPAISDHSSLCCAENIAPGRTLIVPGQDSAGLAVYTFMYRDSASSWGHRQNVLGYAPLVDNAPGHYNWIGIGVATGGAPYDVFYVLDFFGDSPSSPYTPPSTADTQPPSMSPPTIVDSNTVQVTNVQDDSDGSTNGVAGVTGVVFYIGAAVQNGKFQTLAATQTAPGTWTATLSATDPSTLHAVAVDGSGNYTDCVGNAPSC